MLSRWQELPDFLRTPEVRPYYEALAGRRAALCAKRCVDVAAAAAGLAATLPLLCLAALAIKLEDPQSGVLYRQKRVTQNGRSFEICKLRTMRAGQAGAPLTSGQDRRITEIGRLLRRCKVDELPQLYNVLTGEMTLVGTRPEVPQYVAAYTPEMCATLLLPAGITSRASLRFRQESELLPEGAAAQVVYLNHILPCKMRDNLCYLREFSLREDLCILLETALGFWEGIMPSGGRASACAPLPPRQRGRKGR